MDYYLAVDIGASSGRHILGHMEGGRIVLEEVYRFQNSMKKIGEELCWDVDRLFLDIIAGMVKCREMGKIPVSVGIDTWGVDFVLLDQDGRRMGNTVGYRDRRTEGMDRKVCSFISEEELYQRTGIQKQIFNTIYQLMALKEKHPEYLEEAESLLLMPDYFHYMLSGVKRSEYTNATTTQLVHPEKKTWDLELISRLGYPEGIFREIAAPGTKLGCLKDEIQNIVGFNCEVILPAAHDTGSAVAAIPTEDQDVIYISSGTWSLLGIEREKPDCGLKSREHNFTNEGGYEYRFRYLKNIMGLWMIQSVQKELKEEISFAGLCELSSRETITSLVDCNDKRFLAPESMIKEVKAACLESGQPVPETPGELAAVIYNSLALCYKEAAEEIEELTGKTYHVIHIIGGGANADYLNQLTVNYTGKKVAAGPSEATAMGNVTVQMLAKGELNSLSEARRCIGESTELKVYRRQQ